MNQEPLPQIHLIRDTDLSVFAYELHIFAGDFLRECEFNMRSLATNTGADSIAIMGKNHMWLSDALFAYCSTADLHQMISTTEFIGARAFLFHTDRREGGHLYGDVLMMDLDTLRQDIKRNILYPCGVNVERKDGSAATVSLKEWTEMELYEKDALKSWGFSYAPNQVTEWQYHYSTMFRQWMDQAFRYMPQDLEERLNMQYMEAAQNPDMDKYRIPQGTAKQMSQKYSEEYYSLKAELEQLREQLSAFENAGGRAQKFVKLIDRYADFTDLTPTILNEFISRIEVHERDKKRAKQAIQHIGIYFNHIGRFENELTQLAEPTEQEIRQMREEIEEARKEKSRAYHRNYSREYRARNLEKQREYDRIKAREYRAKKKAQAAAALSAP